MQLCRTILLVEVLSVLLVVAYGVAAPAPCGPGDVTVDAFVACALADNPELQGVRAEVDAAQGRIRQAELRPNPMLELGYQDSVTGTDNNLTAMLTVPLDLNGRKAGRVGVAARTLEMKRAQILDRARRLRAEVQMKAGALLAAQRNLQFTEELLQVNRNALDLLHGRVGRGAAPPLEANLLRVEVNRLEASRQMLASQVQVALLQLKALAGLGPDAPVSLRGVLHTTPPPFDLQEGLRRALATRSDVLMAQADVAMAEAMILKEQAEGRWDASVNVGYMRQRFGYMLNGLTERGDLQPIDAVFHYVGGGVTVMLPVRNRNQGNIAAAFAEVQAAAHRMAAIRLAIGQDVTAAFTQYEAAHRALEIYTQGVREVARQNLEVVRKTYELGRTSLLDLIAEQRRYIDIEMGYTVSLQQTYDAVVGIERAVGAGEH
ncbi:MAG: TolC family protein [Candidatus Tectimicrobiota bacterium]